MQKIKFWFCCLLLLAGLLLSSCLRRSATEPLFILSGSTPTSQAGNGPLICLWALRLPEYLQRPELVVLLNENEIKLLKYGRWAQSLPDAMNTALLLQLQTLLGEERVTTRQAGWPKTAWRLEYDFREFSGHQSGKFRVSGSCHIRRQAAAVSEILPLEFELSCPPEATALVQSYDQALKQIADETAAFLRKLAQPNLKQSASQ